MRGPGSKSMNMSLFRIDRGSAATSASSCALEIFNLFNWVNYGFPAANVSNPGTFGTHHQHARRSAGDAVGG